MNEFLKFSPEFETECLEIFDSNVDPYFAENEKEYFVKCLRDDTEMQDYYVLSTEEGIVACGGFVPDEGNVVVLSWGMVRRDLHKKGYGADLLEHRLKLISEKHPTAKVKIHTSQFTEKFFNRYGFKTIKTKKDGYGKGLHTVTMILKPSNDK